MSNELYITRKEDWADDEGPDITFEEWIHYLSYDKSLELDQERAVAVDPRVASGAKDPTHAVWTEWPGSGKGDGEAWLWLELGNLVASDPDAAFRQKMFLIADALGARLVGEDGEVYNSVGDAERGARRPWWKFW